MRDRGWGGGDRVAGERKSDRAKQGERRAERERESVRGRHRGRNVSSLSARAKRPGEGLALLAFFISRSSSRLTRCPGRQMLPWRSPVSLREEAFVLALGM